MTKKEADNECMMLFGMDSDDYARKILKAFHDEQQTEKTEVHNERIITNQL